MSLSPVFGCLHLEGRLLVPRLNQSWCKVTMNLLFLAIRCVGGTETRGRPGSCSWATMELSSLGRWEPKNRHKVGTGRFGALGPDGTRKVEAQMYSASEAAWKSVGTEVRDSQCEVFTPCARHWDELVSECQSVAVAVPIMPAHSVPRRSYCDRHLVLHMKKWRPKKGIWLALGDTVCRWEAGTQAVWPQSRAPNHVRCCLPFRAGTASWQPCGSPCFPLSPTPRHIWWGQSQKSEPALAGSKASSPLSASRTARIPRSQPQKLNMVQLPLFLQRGVSPTQLCSHLPACLFLIMGSASFPVSPNPQF